MCDPRVAAESAIDADGSHLESIRTRYQHRLPAIYGRPRPLRSPGYRGTERSGERSRLLEQRPSPLHVAVGVPATGSTDFVEGDTRVGE